MENQERSIQEVTSILMDSVVKAKLQSFSVLSTKSEKVGSVSGVIVGNPLEIISSLVIMMSKSKEIYKTLKVAVDTFEKLSDSRSFAPETNNKTIMDELMNDLIRRIYNG